MEEALYLGLDAGSTTVKLALVDAREIGRAHV